MRLRRVLGKDSQKKKEEVPETNTKGQAESWKSWKLG
jgi:hypothetical protein